MNITISFPDGFEDSPDVKPFALLRDRILPALEQRRSEFGAMYSDVMGRPEVDPVFLAGFTILQMMARLPDRAAVAACWYDARWRLALGIVHRWEGIHPTTLVNYRKRLAAHGRAQLALEAGLEVMRRDGYLHGCRAIRIDSTHMLGMIAEMSRLECVRETLRMALSFLTEFGGSESWEPWFTRYADRRVEALRNASQARLRATLDQAGIDIRDVLNKARSLGAAVANAAPVTLLHRVFTEQFETGEGVTPAQGDAVPPGAVKNPHDPSATWCTKNGLGKKGWIGYKAQVCETAPEEPRQPGEPTQAIITAVVIQPATSSDHSSLGTVLDAHESNTHQSPQEVFADAGYISAPALRTARENGYELTGPIGPPPHSASRFGSDSFAVDIPGRQAVCPAGVRSTQCARIAERGRKIVSYFFAWQADACAACSLKDKCISKKRRSLFRTLQVKDDHMVVQERRALCKTSAYQTRMKRRSAVEGSHSELKRGGGLRRCRYKGIARTNVQAQFTATACNLRRWAARLCWLSYQKRQKRE